MLRSKVRSFIRHVRNTEGRPFRSLFITHVRNTEVGPEVGPFLSILLDMLKLQKWARFEVRPVIRHVRNTEGGPFPMLRLDVRPVIRHVSNTEGGPFLSLFSRHV